MDKEDVIDIYRYRYRYRYTHTHTHTHTMEKSEIMPFAATWMDLEIIILNEVSQRQISYHLYVESKK